MAAPIGNTNATRTKHTGAVIHLNGLTTNVIAGFLAAEGNAHPSKQEGSDATYSAVRQVFGRQRDEKAMSVE